jgi:hypothetical protein
MVAIARMTCSTVKSTGTAGGVKPVMSSIES